MAGFVAPAAAANLSLRWASGHPDGAPLSGPKLRFGLEIEFLAEDLSSSSDQMDGRPGRRGDDDDNDAAAPGRNFTYAMLAAGIHRRGLPAAHRHASSQEAWWRHHSRRHHPYDQRQWEEERRREEDGAYVTPAGGSRCRESAGCAREYSYWYIKDEDGIFGSDQFKTWITAELTSPILPETEWRAGMYSVQAALLGIRDATGGRAHLNTSCGLHIHVSPGGDGDGAPPPPLTLEVLQRLVTLLWVVERPLLFRLCRRHRRHVHTSLEAFTASSPTRARPITLPDLSGAHMEALTASVPRLLLADPDMDTILRLVWGQDTIEDLQDRIARTIAAAPSIRVRTHPVEQARSVEFRQAEASLDAEFVVRWSHVVLSVFRVAQMAVGRYRAVLEEAYRIVQTTKTKTTTGTTTGTKTGTVTTAADSPAWPALLSLILKSAGTSHEAVGGALHFWEARVAGAARAEQMDNPMDVDAETRLAVWWEDRKGQGR